MFWKYKLPFIIGCNSANEVTVSRDSLGLINNIIEFREMRLLSISID